MWFDPKNFICDVVQKLTTGVKVTLQCVKALLKLFLVYIQEADVLVTVNVPVEAVVVRNQVDLVLVFSSCIEPEVLQNLQGVNSMMLFVR